MIATLETEWKPETGFFWSIRQGNFRSQDFTRTLNAFKGFSSYSNDSISRRVVSLLWFAPIFMQWQVERIRENNGDVTEYTVRPADLGSGLPFVRFSTTPFLCRKVIALFAK